MNPRHVVAPDAHPALVEYMSRPEIASYRFDEARERHTYKDSHSSHACYGINSYIVKRYRADDWVEPGRGKDYRLGKKVGTHKFGCGGASDGINCMTYIEETVRSGGVRPKRGNRFADHILNYLEDRGYKLQAAEVPVHFPAINRMTRVDLVTLDTTGEGFVLWEIKCGYPAARDRKKYKFKTPELQREACSPLNMHYMQTLYNEVGARCSGFPDIVCSKLINVYDTAVTEKKADVEREWKRKRKIRRAEVARDMEKKRKAEAEATAPPKAKRGRAAKSATATKKERFKLTRVKSQKFVVRYNTYVTRIMCADVSTLPKWALDYMPHALARIQGAAAGKK